MVCFPVLRWLRRARQPMSPLMCMAHWSAGTSFRHERAHCDHPCVLQCLLNLNQAGHKAQASIRFSSLSPPCCIFAYSPLLVSLRALVCLARCIMGSTNFPLSSNSSISLLQVVSTSLHSVHGTWSNGLLGSQVEQQAAFWPAVYLKTSVSMSLLLKQVRSESMNHSHLDGFISLLTISFNLLQQHRYPQHYRPSIRNWWTS